MKIKTSDNHLPAPGALSKSNCATPRLYSVLCVCPVQRHFLKATAVQESQLVKVAAWASSIRRCERKPLRVLAEMVSGKASGTRLASGMGHALACLTFSPRCSISQGAR